MTSIIVTQVDEENQPVEASPPDPIADLPAMRSEVTRDAIRNAVLALLVEEHPATISMPSVARRAGVSVRTIYRYFGSKQGLLDDVAELHLRRADAVVSRREGLFDDPEVYLKVLWQDFAENLESVKAQHQSEAGAELRRRRLVDTKRGLLDRLRRGFPDNSEVELNDLADVIVTMLASSAFLELHTRLDRSATEAAELAMWAVKAMQKQFKHDGGMR